MWVNILIFVSFFDDGTESRSQCLCCRRRVRTCERLLLVVWVQDCKMGENHEKGFLSGEKTTQPSKVSVSPYPHVIQGAQTALRDYFGGSGVTTGHRQRSVGLG